MYSIYILSFVHPLFCFMYEVVEATFIIKCTFNSFIISNIVFDPGFQYYHRYQRRPRQQGAWKMDLGDISCVLGT